MALREQLQQAFGATFAVERELDGGGMARLFVVRDESLGRRVVVKVLPHELAGGVSLERFNREIQLLARLQHPNIVPVLTAGAMDGIPYFTMPFVEGESLRSRMTRGSSLGIADLVALLKDVASALAYAHAAGVIHRDIKPDNVLISGSKAMVTDFGVSKAVTAAGGHATSNELTSIGVVVGTPAYMSPEQAAADKVDHRADVYSFGAMAYELIAGRTLFPNRTPQATIAAHIHETPEPLERLKPDVPPALAGIVMRCLEKRVDDRPQTAAELVTMLERAPLAAVQRKSQFALSAAILGALAAVVGWYLVAQNEGAAPPDAAPSARLEGAPTTDAPAPRRPTLMLDLARPVNEGDTVPFRAIARTATGLEVRGVTPQYRSSDSSVLQALSGNRVAGRRVGSALLIASYTGRWPDGSTSTVIDTAFVVVRAPTSVESASVPIRATAAPRSGPYVKVESVFLTPGESGNLRFSAFDDSGRRVPDLALQSSIMFRSSDTSIIVILPGFRIEAKAPGGAFVVARWTREGGDPLYDSAMVIVRGRIVPATDSTETPRFGGELGRAIALYEAFNVEAAMPIFRRLIAAGTLPRDDLARAYAYLGASLSVLAVKDSAVRMLRRAIELDPTIDLDPSKFASSELGALEDAKNFALLGIAALPDRVIRQGSQPYQFRVTVIGSGDLRVLMRRRDQPADPEVFYNGRSQSARVIQWGGVLSTGTLAPAGRYEILAVMQGVYAARSDTARRFFRITQMRDTGGVYLRLTPDSASSR